jgi:hypothetical protein
MVAKRERQTRFASAKNVLSLDNGETTVKKEKKFGGDVLTLRG